MSGIKQLANQTIWYGLSNIVGRFISYLLTPLLTYSYFSPAQFGDISLLFAYAAFLNIIFTYGMETSYFRFTQNIEEKNVFNTSFTSLLISTTIFCLLLLLPVQYIANFMEIGKHPEYVVYIVAIVAFDTLAVIPFSKIRFEGRPRKFAFIKLINIIINFGLVLFVLYVLKPLHESNANNFIGSLYDPKIGIGYIFIAGLVASIITLLLLAKEFKGYVPTFDKKLFTELLIYSTPLIIVGFGGMINETIDRFMIVKRFDGTVEAARAANGIYSANNKLAILIVIFIQTFRMGAEPFFFKNSSKENSKETYARIMNFFVIATCLCFLGVVLYLDVWKHFMGIKKHPEYLQGLRIVPLLMMSKLFLGIYYNLSIWYKLTNHNKIGAWITFFGAFITIVFNYFFIPSMGFMACAIANFLCYGSMMWISYSLGQKHYPIPYNVKKSIFYVILASGLFLIHNFLRNSGPGILIVHTAGIFLTFLFVVVVIVKEKAELMHIPIIQKIYKR